MSAAERAATARVASETSRSYNALNRLIEEHTPDDSTTILGYDEGGRLNQVSAFLRGSSTSTTYVGGITYNARGQRASVSYGTSTTTTASYIYDAQTFRLTRLYTVVGSGDPRQHLNYSYDAVGNIIGISDAAVDTVFFDNTAIDGTRTFAYDALYRLVSATGREKSDSAAPDGGPPAAFHTGTWTDTSTALGLYTETYVYDLVGNLQSVTHDGLNDWSRAYSYADASNRLVGTTLTTTSGTVDHTYGYDHRGTILQMPEYASGDNVLPDYRDLVRTIRLGDGTPKLRFFYDRSGQRVRKVVLVGSTVVEDRRYLGRWETWDDGSEQIETLHIMDDQSRVAMVESKIVGGTTTTTARFQLSDHLGTAQWELAADGALLTYEEFHPYGSTAWWFQSTTVGLKRYRYTAMERDEETGLQCHGVRYYAPWLGRWIQADPIGLGDGVNRFAYCHGRPTCGRDESGMDGPAITTADAPPAVPSWSKALSMGAMRIDKIELGSEGFERKAAAAGVPILNAPGLPSANRPVDPRSPFVVALHKLENLGLSTDFYKAGVGRGTSDPVLSGDAGPTTSSKTELGKTDPKTGVITVFRGAEWDTAVHEAVHAALDITGIPDSLKASILGGMSAEDQARVTALAPEGQATFFSEAIAYTVESKVTRLEEESAHDYKSKAAAARAAGKPLSILDKLIAKRDAQYVGGVDVVDAPTPEGRGEYKLSVSDSTVTQINSLLHLNLPLETTNWMPPHAKEP